MVGLVGVAAVVTYLIWTGVSDTMVYYLTPSELEARILEDPTFREVGVKVSGRVVPGSHEEVEGQLLHRFDIHDLTEEDVVITVEYDNVLPDTFSDSESMVVDAVVEGRFRADGVFEATTVLTKCGSRYEASPEELANG
jgi:cytochrome c-type biogenesis protein CcmE